MDSFHEQSFCKYFKIDVYWNIQLDFKTTFRAISVDASEEIKWAISICNLNINRSETEKPVEPLCLDNFQGLNECPRRQKSTV